MIKIYEVLGSLSYYMDENEWEEFRKHIKPPLHQDYVPLISDTIPSLPYCWCDFVGFQEYDGPLRPVKSDDQIWDIE